MLDYVKTYKNFSSIFLNAFIKKKFPVNVIFRNGKSLLLKDAQQIRFFSSHNSHCYCVPEKTSITISPSSLPSVKFSDWEYGGDMIVFSNTYFGSSIFSDIRLRNFTVKFFYKF